MEPHRVRIWSAGPLGYVLEVAAGSPRIELAGTADADHEVVDLATRAQPDVLVLDESRLDDVVDITRQVARTSPRTRVLVLHGGDAGDGDEVLPELLTDATAVLGTALHPVRVVAEINRLLVDATRAAAVPLPRTLESAGTARRLVQRAAAAWGAGGTEDTLALLATELVANAVRHGGGDIDIVVRVSDDVVRVEVRDSSSGVPTMGRLLSEEESGRGLALVEALSHAWGIEPAGDGKSVWFELDLRDPQNV